jgi:hypothetical protein
MTDLRIALVMLFAAVPLSRAPAQRQDLRLRNPGSLADQPPALPATNRALREDAVRNGSHTPVSRVALFEIALPDDSAEFAAVGGNALMVLTALSWCPYELPLARAYLTVRGHDTALTLLSSVVSLPEDTTVLRVYGQHRVDALYLVPVEAIAAGGGLNVDFGEPPADLPKNVASVCASPDRAKFTVYVFRPGDVPEAYLQSVGRLAASEVDWDRLIAFVERVYPDFLAAP